MAMALAILRPSKPSIRRWTAVVPSCSRRLYFPTAGSVGARRGFNGYAVEQFSDDEYECEFENHPKSSSVANIDEWRWKLSMLLRNGEEQEIISRIKVIGVTMSRSPTSPKGWDFTGTCDERLFSIVGSVWVIGIEIYGKVVVASKVPLPNYRPDLDDKRPQRENSLSIRQARDKLEENANVKHIEDLVPSENPDSLVDASVMERVLQRRSLRLRNLQRAWQESPEGTKMLNFRKSLPAYKEKDMLLSAIARNQVVVISGETGCGKTTQLPQYILESEIESGRGAFCNIICTQPRRISAMSVAERVSAERGEDLGESGFTYPVRAQFLEDILEITGYKLTSVNQIDNYGQEKLWKTQRQLLPRKRKNQINTLVEDALSKSSFERYSSRTRDSLASWSPDCIGFNLIEAVLCHICRKERSGAVLVFMTGWDDISCLKDQLKAHPLLGDPNRVLVLTCHGSMATSEQKLIFEKPPPNIRKIVLATNMAEASITINDIVFVVDCGKAKETTYDALNNTPCLLPSWISQASARQRRGRAGRVQPGECYHLYPRCVYDAFAEYQLPELLRTPLNSLCLQIKSLQLDSIGEFLSAALQPPEPLAVQNAIDFLKVIGALDEKENLTNLGQYLSILPVDPKLGKMLIMGAVFRCLDPILTIVSGLSVRDPFLLPQDKKDLAGSAKSRFSAKDYSDHMALVRAYEGWKDADREGSAYEYCWRNFLSSQALQAIHSLRKQFNFILKDAGLIDADPGINNSLSHNQPLVRAIICSGLFPGISSVVHREKSMSFKTMEDGQLQNLSTDIHKEGKYLMLAVQELVSGDLCEGRFVFGRTNNTTNAIGEVKNDENNRSPSYLRDGTNPKALLQTLLTRAGHHPPKYKTKHLKTNEFTATVEFKGMQFVGRPKKNKQLAEREAAVDALGWLTRTSHYNVNNRDEDSDGELMDLTEDMLKVLSKPRKKSKKRGRR
ncbi:putative pre-mRNA-splicing factor ATP-dependent RNA helicase [Acorus calamus]|uniref:Pre-mRNA-splicing factor ATP-dependent RNA helicase n=1 Tax=Acorus calamus TaxID=4465 RepID=A0AAV9CFW8_ACOCL|nr:putative pre-mRNA-splicing factor ATP-dependent RNA helicase [Acorus calamus]